MSAAQIYTLIAIIVGSMTIGMPLLKFAFRVGELVSVLRDVVERLDRFEERMLKDAIRNPRGRG